MIEEELRAAIKANTVVNALISGRVYPDIAPENAVLPCVVYDRNNTTADEGSYSLDGPGLYRTVITLSSLGKRWQDAHSVADALRTALENKRGALTPTQQVELILLRDFRDEGFQELPESYRFDMDLEIVHR